ncbi:hypothetical protein O181_130032 [Austropuccinia psidii MF-1]|uniref:Integrase catalytic domain-containing protein n=1 Tax=Austropuccinia psidii MF-1 TaxID=1389203 RepID=A0A9Q3QC31_9BASI|nr:hypothetical protein [Austropuccinia psidii MF-1]
MIQNLEDMIRRFCAYRLEFTDSDGFTHDWCTLIPALELAFKKSVHSSTGHTPAMLEKGWNPRLQTDTLRKNMSDIHPTPSSFKIMLYKTNHHSKQSMDDAFEYAKQRNSKTFYARHFFIVSLHGTNAVQVELNFELQNNHNTFPVSLIKPYQPADKELFPSRNPTLSTVPSVEQSEDKKIKEFVKERRLRGKNQREYLVRYTNPVHEDESLKESEIPESNKLLKRFRH